MTELHIPTLIRLAEKQRNLFKYVSSRCALKALRQAMAKTTMHDPRDVNIGFVGCGVRCDYHCRIFKFYGYYIIAGWKMKKILYFPVKVFVA